MQNLKQHKKLEITTENLNQVPFSDTLYINQKCQEMQLEGQKIYKFGFGQSPFFPSENIIDALKDNADFTAYANTQGDFELREKIAGFHSSENNKLNVENIFVGPGSKILIYSVLAAFKKATLLLPSPAWVSYEPQARLLGKDILRIESDFQQRYRLEANQLNDAILNANIDNDVQKILILTYPGNPDGLSYSPEELKNLAGICRKHNILVISDEIYGLLNYQGNHKSILDYYPEATIVTSGLSKWGAMGGWRLGCMYYTDDFVYDLKSTLLGIFSETFSCVTYPVQKAAILAYDNLEQHDDFLSKQRQILQYLSDYSYKAFNNAKILTPKGEGGFYLILNFSQYKKQLALNSINSDKDLCSELLKQKQVALLPGSAFGMQPEDYIVRYAFVDFDGKNALANFNGDFTQEFTQKYFCDIFEGVSRICNFVENL